MKRARHAKRGRQPLATGATPAGGERVAVPVLAPRNPLVAPAHRRKAGAHDGGARQRRRLEKQEVRKLLDE
jgi:hypothetical protein